MVYPMNKFFKSHFIFGYGKSYIHNFHTRNTFEIRRVQIQEPKHGRHSRPFVPIHKYMSRNYIECVYRRFFPARSLSDSKMKSSINSDRIFYKTAAMARFVSVDS